MTLNTSDVLDLSKENIKPLRQGRKAAQLKTALQAQSDPETYQQLTKQREKLEYAIRMYDGDDPLDPYYNYVIWLEQSFPTNGRENNLILLLEDILLKFKDCKKYKQDPRLIQLLIKYINVQSNPLELYQLVYNQGLGTMCSIFYKAWAEELDKMNDFKRADQIFQLGLRCHAEPINELQEAHIQFQLSLARRLLEGTTTELIQPTEQPRTVLSKLQPSKLKSNRLSKDSAGTLQLVHNRNDSKHFNFGSEKFKVYQEDEQNMYIKSEYKNESENLPKGSVAYRENIMKPGKWCGLKQKQSSTFGTSTSSFTPSFQIHEDPETVYNTVKTVMRPCALRIRKTEFKCPVAIFGPPDPTKKPMYPKQMVYVGGRDIQLEEIRAAFYWKKIEEIDREKTNRNEKDGVNSFEKYSADRDKQSTSDESVSRKSNFTFSDAFIAEPRTKQLSHKYSVSVPVGNHFDEVTDENNSTNLNSYKQTVDENTVCVAKNNIHSFNATRKFTNCYEQPVCADENIIPQQIINTENTNTNTNFAATVNISNGEKSVINVLTKENIISEKNHKFLKPKDIPPSVKSAKSLVQFNVFSDESTFERSPFEFGINEVKKNCDKNISKENFVKDSVFISEKFNDVTSDKYQKTKDNAFGFSIFEPNNVSIFHHSHSPSTSMTINTRAAMNVIQQMWESPIAERNFNHINSDKQSFSICCEDLILKQENKSTEFIDDISETQKINTVHVQPTKLPFSVYCEDTVLKKNNEQPKQVDDLYDVKIENNSCVKLDKYPFPIYCEDSISNVDEKPLKNIDDLLDAPPFSKAKFGFKMVHQDDSNQQLNSLKKSNENGMTCDTPLSLPLIVPVNLQDTPLEPHNKENRPPKKYFFPEECKPIHVFHQQINEDTNSYDKYAAYEKNIELDDDTCNTNAFRIVLPSSTPCSHPEQSKANRKSLSYNNGSYLSEDNNFSICYAKSDQKSSALYQKSNKNTTNLSLILENSKEQGNISSSCNCNAVHK